MKWRLISLAVILVAAAGAAGLGAASSGIGVNAIARWVDSIRGLDGGPVGDDPTPVAFAIRPGESASAVADDLMRAGLIRSTSAFRIEVEMRDAAAHIAAGDYELRRTMSVREVLDTLLRGPTISKRLITIPEGWRAEEIAQYLQARGVVDAAQFLNAVAGHDEALGVALPAHATSFEGYLFPETYDFGPDPTVESVLETLYGQFQQRVTDSLVQGAAARGLTLHQMVTLASIIEREATEPSERKEIAAVFENRLAKGMPLQADPTVQYARFPFGSLSQTRLWAGDLGREDLQRDSPYNTYRVRGLPPGPIANPGLAAMRAVTAPSDDPWLYFVAKGDGTHLFSATLDDHNRNVARVSATASR
ncbi:MAG TPA: endolytic transglycosylase MltG [Chloroflexota bacterium]|nr:endolytic transglycosylase MltG [Chloroflexota bacterium]